MFARNFLILTAVPRTFIRTLHNSLLPPPIPPPTPRTPDVSTFLTQIGRNTIQHAPKFPTWEVFFASSSKQMRNLGIEPPRDRRYILHWREKYRVLGGDIELREHKRGVKVDGGERRRAAVRAKRWQDQGKERKKLKEAGKVAEQAKFL